jgi:hypothetical protein
MTASRVDILARLDVARESWDWPHVLDLMEQAGLTVDIPDFDATNAPSYFRGWSDAKAGRQYGEGRQSR